MKILRTDNKKDKDIIERLIEKPATNFNDYELIVNKVIKAVRKQGDKAIIQYTKEFDKIDLAKGELKVSASEIKEAYKLIDNRDLELIKKAAKRIESFHSKQVQNSWFSSDEEGIFLGQLMRPIQKVGIYVPGGKAIYPSSVLMNAIPAKVAGVKEIIMCSPAKKDKSLDPLLLIAADIVGIKEIYRIGGIQAVAAMAYGTETIPRVFKIVGPGNIYVTTAKKSLFGEVGIDMIAGPSEILIIADEKADPSYIAADLLSQAEHDEKASVVLITDSEFLAEEVRKEVLTQVKSLNREEIIACAIETSGAIIISKDIKESFDLANRFAPEHLELVIENPFQYLYAVENAGAIFIGNYTPEPMGDYMAGPNHVLPTGGTAKFSSSLGVLDFLKRISVISYSQEAIKRQGPEAADFARLEGLQAHEESIRKRL